MDKRKDGKKGNTITTKESVGINLGDSISVSTTLSPDGDVKDMLHFPMKEEGYRAFAQRCGRTQGSGLRPS